MLNGKTLEAFIVKKATKQGYPLSSLFLNIILEELANAIDKRKKRGIKVGNEKAKIIIIC